MDKLNHSLFEFTDRERVQAVLYEYVIDHFVAPNGPRGEVPSRAKNALTVGLRDETFELREQSDKSPSLR
jgi:hypothetical protein